MADTLADPAKGVGLHMPFPEPPAEGHAIEVAPGVLWMRLPLPLKLDHVNVFALRNGPADAPGWTIIDTGFHSRQGVALWERLLAGPLEGLPVARVIVTHHHPDHVGMAAWFVARGAALWMPRTSWLMTRMLTLDEQDSYPSETMEFYRRSGMDADVLAKRLKERPFNYADCVLPLPLGYRRLREGEQVHFGGRDWQVRMGDGHAPEHATFWSQTDTLVIGGDQLLPSISPNLGVCPTEPEADPVGDWLDACERLAPHARPDQLVLPGHKLPFTGLPFRMAQFVENHHSALARLLAFLATPRRGGECFAPLYRREIGAGEYDLALVEAIGHLNHLHQRRQVRRWLGEGGSWRWQAVDGAD